MTARDLSGAKPLTASQRMILQYLQRRAAPDADLAWIEALRAEYDRLSGLHARALVVRDRAYDAERRARDAAEVAPQAWHDAVMAVMESRRP